MTKDELKSWFWDKYNSCYCAKCVESPKSIYMYYDKNFTRQKKLSRILNTELIYPTKIEGICLFELDYLNNKLYCEYENIWIFLIHNSNYKQYEISKLIECWMKEVSELKLLTPATINRSYQRSLEKELKIEILT